jgi:signal transduction histidine kinase
MWRYFRPVLAPTILCALVILTLWEPISSWLSGEEKYDQEALKEWLREARVSQTISELVREYLARIEDTQRESSRTGTIDPALRADVETRREKIFEQLQALGNPPTKMYPRQLPLFPLIYSISIRFHDDLGLPPIVWDSGLPRQKSQVKTLDHVPVHDSAWVDVKYHLHAYSQRQYVERQEAMRRLWLGGLGLFFAVLAFVWIYVAQRHERDRQRQRALVEQEKNEAERLRLEEELRRQEAERRQHEAERQNLELKSQLFANIGIMAGSYAHNIKNLLVRPNDLLRRCLEEDKIQEHQARMLREVRTTLGTVTERLQQILQTVRRDPSRSERGLLDLNVLVGDIHSTWHELAREKWKLELELDLAAPSKPLWIEGDASHLQQALENLVFNARDATFEMRNYLRDQARKTAGHDGIQELEPAPADPGRRQAILAAAGWKGRVILRTRRQDAWAVLEVVDNGIGMTDEVRRRCTETHFSTKRDNALFAGLSAGMGLGLSFVTVILEHHQAQMEIASKPLEGACFHIRFPLSRQAGEPAAAPPPAGTEPKAGAAPA